MGILALIQLVCAVWVIIEVLKRKDKSTSETAIWIIAAIFFGIITAIVYYFKEKK